MAGSSFHYDNQNAKELQRFESLAKVKGRKTSLYYVRMLYISYDSVCELETQRLVRLTANGIFDRRIGQKDHLWMGTTWRLCDPLIGSISRAIPR